LDGWVGALAGFPRGKQLQGRAGTALGGLLPAIITPSDCPSAAARRCLTLGCTMPTALW
jgi:hypothetical protein